MGPHVNVWCGNCVFWHAGIAAVTTLREPLDTIIHMRRLPWHAQAR